MENVLPVFEVENQNSKDEKFILSLTSVMAIPAIFTVGFLSSFSDREFRLRFLFPIQLTVLSVIFPIFVIAVNPKLKQFAIATFLKIFEQKTLFVLTKMISSKVFPAMN